jgi:hypothetical protein
MVVDQIEHDVRVGGEQRSAIVTVVGEVPSVHDVLVVLAVEEPLRGSLVELVGHEPCRPRSRSFSPSPKD